MGSGAYSGQMCDVQSGPLEVLRDGLMKESTEQNIWKEDGNKALSQLLKLLHEVLSGRNSLSNTELSLITELKLLLPPPESITHGPEDDSHQRHKTWDPSVTGDVRTWGVAYTVQFPFLFHYVIFPSPMQML